MLKADAQEATRERLVDAAIETLRTTGAKGASARAIAKTGGVNQALVFYYFGSVNGLLLAALEETSRRRMDRYSAATAAVETLPELIEVAAEVYREDLDSGHIKVLAEVIAASSGDDDLGAAVVNCMQPWVDFTRDAVTRVLRGSPFESLVPADDIAFAIVALYLGVEMLTNLDGDRARAESLFAAVGTFALLFGRFTS